MDNRKMYRVLSTVVFVLVFAGITLAHEVTITEPAKLGNGPEIQPGTYRVEVVKNQDTSEAVFYKGRDLVVRVPVTLAEESTKSRQTEVHFDILDSGRLITQIRVAGWKERLVFKEPAKGAVVAE